MTTQQLTAYEVGAQAARQRNGTPAPAVLTGPEWTDSPYNRGRLHAVERGGDVQAAEVARATLRAWDRAAMAPQLADQAARARYDAACAQIQAGHTAEQGLA